MPAMNNATTFAVVVRSAGGPDVLEYGVLALAPPAAGEVRVRHTAIGINFIDVYFRSGRYPPPQYPFVPGLEGAGVVEALGDGVTEFAVGDRVAYASRPLGAYAAARNFPADRLVRLPAGIADDVAAASMLKGMTSRMLLRRVFRVEAGHVILMHAAAGGVGSILVPWARSLGATVIGTVGSDAKAGLARASGCQHTIVYTRERFVERVRELTGGRGVDVVYDSVGKDTFAGSLECLKPMGTLVSFGQSSGPVAPLDIGELAKKSLTLSRASLFEYTAARADLVASANDLFDVLARGVVPAQVERRYPLAEAARAHADLEARRTSGSGVLVP